MHISRDNSTLRANDHTGRFQPDLGTMSTIIALGSRLTIRIDIKCIIRTRLHTGFTTNTATGVKVYNTIAPLIQRPGGTNSDTGSIITVVAAVHQKITARVRKLALLNVLDPRAIDANRHIMLRLAGNRTGMTTNTLPLINHKRVLRH